MSDESQEELDRKQRDEIERQEQERDWKLVLSTEGGRRAMSRVLFEYCGLQSSAFSPDGRVHAFNEGQRKVGLELNAALERIARDPWCLMHAERLERIRLAEVDPAPHKTEE